MCVQGIEEGAARQFQAQIHSVCDKKLQALALDGEQNIYRSGNLGSLSSLFLYLFLSLFHNTHTHTPFPGNLGSILGNLGMKYWGGKIRMDG